MHQFYGSYELEVFQNGMSLKPLVFPKSPQKVFWILFWGPNTSHGVWKPRENIMKVYASSQKLDS